MQILAGFFRKHYKMSLQGIKILRIIDIYVESRQKKCLLSFGYVKDSAGMGIFMEKLLNRLELSAPLKLDINSGAGEGAVLAFTLFDAGIKAYNEMETFAEAGVHAEVEEFAHSVQVKGK